MLPGPGMYAAGQKWLQKARIDVAQARNVCSRPEMVAEGQDRCSTSQECMQQARMVAEGQDRCNPGQKCMQQARN